MDRSQHSSNKGQLTIFMVMAVVVLFIAIFAFILSSQERVHLEFTNPSIQAYLDNCLAQTAEEGLELLGKQGGRIQLQDHVSLPHYGVTYWLTGNTLGIPTPADMENELEGYVGNNLGRCIRNFEDFKDKGWQVEARDLSTTASINLDEVSIVASYPLTITQKGSSISLDGLSARLPVRLMHIHGIASGAVQSIHKDGKIDLTMLDSSGLNTTIFPYKNALIYRFSDEKSKLKNRPFVFNIAVS